MFCLHLLVYACAHHYLYLHVHRLLPHLLLLLRIRVLFLVIKIVLVRLLIMRFILVIKYARTLYVHAPILVPLRIILLLAFVFNAKGL